MPPPVDRWTDGDVTHTSQRWTWPDVLAEILRLDRRPRVITITETITQRTVVIEEQ